MLNVGKRKTDQSVCTILMGMIVCQGVGKEWDGRLPRSEAGYGMSKSRLGGAASQTPHVDSRATLPGATQLNSLRAARVAKRGSNENAFFDLACLARTAPRFHAGTGRIAYATETATAERTMSRWVYSRAVCGVGYLGRRLKPTLLEAL